MNWTNLYPTLARPGGGNQLAVALLLYSYQRWYWGS